MSNNKLRIAIISDKDKVWALPLWDSVIPKLKKADYEIRGFWVCPGRLGKHTNGAILRWYLRNFGVFDVAILGILATIRRAMALLARQQGRGAFQFTDLSSRHNLHLHQISNPNNSEFQRWMQREKIDLLVIMVSHILNAETLAIPRLGTINKHAALLPSYKGIFPYIWATIDGADQGVSFHEVVQEIDAGRVLFQECMRANKSDSMIGFYDKVMSNYGTNLLIAISRMREGITAEIELSKLLPSYKGLPSPKDMQSFRSKGGKIIRFADLFHHLRMPLYR